MDVSDGRAIPSANKSAAGPAAFGSAQQSALQEQHRLLGPTIAPSSSAGSAASGKIPDFHELAASVGAQVDGTAGTAVANGASAAAGASAVAAPFPAHASVAHGAIMNGATGDEKANKGDPSSAVPTATAQPAPEAVPPFAGRTFLVLVNYSEWQSDGHILLAKPDDSALASPEASASGAHVAALTRSTPLLLVRRLFVTFDGLLEFY